VLRSPGGEFPRAFYAIIRVIDRFTDVTGKLIAMTMLFLVVTISYEVVMRYGFGAPTIWVYESSAANGAAFMLEPRMRFVEGRARSHRHLLGELLGANEGHRRPDFLLVPLLSSHDHFHADQLGRRLAFLRDRRTVAGKRVARDHVAVPSHDTAGSHSPHDPGRVRGTEVLVPGPVRARVRAQGKIEI
jgi:hypothetical protein